MTSIEQWQAGQQIAGFPPWDGTGFPFPVGADGNPDLPGDGPVLTALVPDTAAITDADFEGHLTGTGFTAESVIVWNDADEPTTFNSDTDLSTLVVPSAVTSPTTVEVYVRNADGSESNVLTFTWTGAVADPNLGWTKQELLDFAAEHEPPITVPTSGTKAEILAAILAYIEAHPEEN